MSGPGGQAIRVALARCGRLLEFSRAHRVSLKPLILTRLSWTGFANDALVVVTPPCSVFSSTEYCSNFVDPSSFTRVPCLANQTKYYCCGTSFCLSCFVTCRAAGSSDECQSLARRC